VMQRFEGFFPIFRFAHYTDENSGRTQIPSHTDAGERNISKARILQASLNQFTQFCLDLPPNTFRSPLQIISRE
jgi:hypothetical protein